MRALTIATTLLLIATGCTVALAQTGTWTSHGPDGGSISAIAVDPASPSTVFAGSLGDGVFSSTDAAETWNSVGPANAQVVALAIDALDTLGGRQQPGRHEPGASAVVYAGTLGLGVFKSVDGGRTWEPRSSGLTIPNVRALVIDPSDSNVLYAGTTFGVFKSVDAGASWTSSGLQTDIRALAIDPRSLSVYAGTGSGVFKSPTGGPPWTSILSGQNRSDIRALAMGPQTSNSDNSRAPLPLYAGIGEGQSGGSGAVFKTFDGGATWTNTGLATPGVRSLAVDPHTPRTLYVGSLSSNVFKTSDAGETWTTLNTGLVNAAVLSLSVSPDRPGAVYAGTNDGVVKSIDGGASWTVMNTRLTNTFVFALALDRTTASTLYAGMDEPEIFKTTDAGNSWSLTNSGLPSFVSVQALAIDAVTPTTVYAGLFGGGVFRSTDGGATWSAANIGLTNTFVQAVVTDPVTTDIVYAGATGGSLGGVFKSLDGGASWIKTVLAVDVKAFAIDPMTAPRVIYVATPTGVFKSFDAGDNWFSFNKGLPPSLATQALAIAPATDSTPTTVYVGTPAAGVFKSTDGGVNWTPASTGLTNVAIQALAVDPVNPSTVYAGTGAGVFKSVDAGGSWTAINTGLTNTAIRALTVNPVTPSIVYAATLGGGVFVLQQ